MKKLITILALAMILLISLSFEANAVPRRYLVEDHTGGWCQYCPIGIMVIDILREEYKDLVIPIAVHNGDAMANEFSNGLAQKFKINNYPTGLINRREYTYTNSQGKNVSETIMSPSDWPYAIEADIKKGEEAVVDVRIKEWAINKETMTLTATVEAEMMEEVPSQLAFNLLVLEDRMKGVGSAWRQVNFMSGNSQMASTPFYNLPRYIYGFPHDNVLTYMADGIDGSTEGFTKTAEKGKTYTRQYTIDLNKTAVKVQDLDKIWIAAIVHKTEGSSEVLNCISANKTDYPIPSKLVKAEFTTDEKEPEYINSSKGETVKRSITLKNSNSEDNYYYFTVNSESSIIPKNWEVKINDLENEKVFIKKGETKEINFEIISDSEVPNYAHITFSAIPETDDNSIPVLLDLQKGVLTKGAEIFVYQINGITPFILSNGIPEYSDKVATIPFDAKAMTTLDQSDSKLSIFVEGDDICSLIHTSPEVNEVEKIFNSSIENNIPLLINSPVDMFSITNPSAINNLNLAQPIKKFFNEKLFIDGYTGNSGIKEFVNQQGYLLRQDIELEAHDINKGLGDEITLNTTFTHGYTLFGDVVKSLDPSKAKIIMNYRDQVATNPTGAVAAITLPLNKALYFGYDFGGISELNKRILVLNNSITWLLDKPSSVFDINNTNIADIKVTPNPSTDFINVTLNANNGDKGSVYINDVQGSIVKTVTKNTSIQSNYNINVTDLPNGKYFIVTDINGIRSINSVIISK